MRIEILDWPADGDVVRRLRATGRPRLLVVAAGEAPPRVSDPLEDWIRADSDPVDFEVRLETLRRRFVEPTGIPIIDGSGVLHHGGRWVALSAVEVRIVSALLARFATVVGRDSLVLAGQSRDLRNRNLLDVQMVRVRRRVATLGLEIRTVRSRGYLLQFATPEHAPPEHAPPEHAPGEPVLVLGPGTEQA